MNKKTRAIFLVILDIVGDILTKIEWDDEGNYISVSDQEDKLEKIREELEETG